ncbi:hypothetical protein FKM82_009596 [Ascaphus truei]
MLPPLSCSSTSIGIKSLLGDWVEAVCRYRTPISKNSSQSNICPVLCSSPPYLGSPPSPTSGEILQISAVLSKVNSRIFWSMALLVPNSLSTVSGMFLVTTSN